MFKSESLHWLGAFECLMFKISAVLVPWHNVTDRHSLLYIVKDVSMHA